MEKLSSETILAYQALCSFSAWALFSDLERESLQGFAQEAAMFSEEPFTSIEPQASACIGGYFERAKTDVEAVYKELHEDRSYLFYMIGASNTSPYESVYRTDDYTMFGPTTLEVRAAYRAYGLAFPQQASEPDDHIGLEFSFVAHLLECAAQGNEAALDDAAQFLSDHLLVFAPVYLANVQTRAHSPFYAAVAKLALATLKALAAELGAQASDVPLIQPFEAGIASN